MRVAASGTLMQGNQMVCFEPGSLMNGNWTVEIGIHTKIHMKGKKMADFAPEIQVKGKQMEVSAHPSEAGVALAWHILQI